jgi:hypothetical protein
MGLEPDLTAAKEYDAQQAAPSTEAVTQIESDVDNNIEGEPSAPKSEAETEIKEEGNKELTALLEETELDVDGIKELFNSDKDLKALLGDRKIEDVLKDAGKFKELETGWAKDDEAKLREDEEPENTIARLDKEVSDLRNGIKTTEQAGIELKGAQEAIVIYDSNITSMVDATDLPEQHKEMMKTILSSSHQLQSVDISNKADVGNMVKTMAEKFGTFSDSVIEDYIADKGRIPKVNSSTPATDTETREKETLTFKEATKQGMEKAKKLFG